MSTSKPKELPTFNNPPAHLRARAVLGNQGQTPVHAVALETCLLDISSIHAPNSPHSPEIFRLRPDTTCISAVPGCYAVNSYLDRALLALPEVALPAEQPGHYVRATPEDLKRLDLVQWVDGLGQQVTHPTMNNGTDAPQPLAQINQCIDRFTERRIQARVCETLMIPPLAEVARRIIALRADPDYALAELVSIVETDPAMAARLVSWANSAYYAVDPPARSIHDALTRVLGFDTVMSLALAMAMGDCLSLPEHELTGVPSFWLEALYTAATMEALGKELPRVMGIDGGLCYLTGLLANFGTLVVAHVFGPQYTRIRNLQEANRHLSHAHCDQHVLGMTRELIGAQLLEEWGLPPEAVLAIRELDKHETPVSAYTHVLRLAGQLLGAQGLNVEPANGADPELVAHLGLQPEQLHRVQQNVLAASEALEGLAASVK